MKRIIQLSVILTLITLTANIDLTAQTCTPTAPVCVGTGNQPAFTYSNNTNFRLQFNDAAGVTEYQFTNGSGNKVFGVNAINGNFSPGATGALQVGANRAAFQFSGDPDAGLFFTGGSPNQYQFRSLTGANVFTIDEDDGDLRTGNIGVNVAPSLNDQIYVRSGQGENGPSTSNIYSYRSGTSGNDTMGGTSWGLFGVDAGIRSYSDWGNPYSAAIYGGGVLDYENSAAVLGAQGSSLYGALGFRDNSQVWAGFFNGDTRIQNGRLDMEAAGESTTAFIQNNYAGSLLKVGMDIRISSGGNGGKYGIRTIVTPDATSNGWGGFFDASRNGNSGSMYGIQAGVSGTGSGSGTNYGVRARTLDGTTAVSYGMYATAEGNIGPASAHYAVYGWAGGATNNWAGYFNGAVFGTSYTTSDRKLKKDIQPMEHALEIIQKLQPKTYTYDRENYDFMVMPEGLQYGLIAQELDEVIPGLTKQAMQTRDLTNDDNPIDNYESFLAVNYTPLIAIALKGIQEQQDEIEELKEELRGKDGEVRDLRDEVSELKDLMQGFDKALSSCCLSHASSAAHSGADQINKSADQQINQSEVPVLGQNVPNPFDQSTTISYYVPATTTSGQIHIMDMKGQQIAVYELQIGLGEVRFSNYDLAAGQYVYTMVLDGSAVATKQMMIN